MNNRCLSSQFRFFLFCLKFYRDFYIKVMLWLGNSISFLYIEIFSDMLSDFVSGHSGSSGSTFLII